jgi:hypothetical protein
VKKLLNKDVSARLTVAQALKHPWVVEGGAPDNKLDNAVLTRMRTFANQSKFKQLVRCVPAPQDGSCRHTPCVCHGA